MVRILIVDDQVQIRKAIAKVLEGTEWVVCGECENGEQAVQQAEILKPHFIFLDIQMPKMNGFEAAKLIVQSQPDIFICIISFHDHPIFVNQAKKHGARGFIPKHRLAHHVVPAVETMLRGEHYFPTAA